MVLVGFFDLTINRYAGRTLRDGIAAEVELLLKTAPGGGARAIAGLVRERERVLGQREFLYLVIGENGRPLAGDMPARAERTGWSSIAVPAPANSREYDSETAEVETLGVRLPHGGELIVGRSTYPIEELREAMAAASMMAAALISLMSVAAAFLIGREFLLRIDGVSAAAARIMDGRLGERLPAIGMGDEFTRLAVNLNAMLDRMQRLMEGIRQVSSDIAHDLRTPLTRLRRRLETAWLSPGEPGRAALAREALEQVDEILGTFGALLRIAQVEGGTGRESFRPVDLSTLLENIRQAYEPPAEDAGMALTADIACGIWVAGDAELLTQLISNLVENALSHAYGARRIVLLAQPAGERAVLAVADDGAGAPQSEHLNLLRRFYRLDRSRSTPGAGLGLAMVQAVAQLHAGEVELADNQPGLVVRVTLPRIAPPPALPYRGPASNP
jgi:signal transduction histidine kinase